MEGVPCHGEVVVVDAHADRESVEVQKKCYRRWKEKRKNRKKKKIMDEY